MKGNPVFSIIGDRADLDHLHVPSTEKAAFVIECDGVRSAFPVSLIREMNAAVDRLEQG